jgi:hypothetical protein
LSARTWTRAPLLFKRRKIPKDIRQLIDTICIIDAAQVGRCKRLSKLRKYVFDSDLIKRTGFMWKGVRGDISVVLDLPIKGPTITRYAGLLDFIRPSLIFRSYGLG